MRNNAAVPSLSKDGWVNTPMKALDYLFSHIFLSDYSQTYIYYTRVTSIPYILFRNQLSVGDLSRDLKVSLEEYFSNYYDTVNCEVVENESDSTSKSLTIFLEVIDDSRVYTLSKVIKYSNSKVTSIIDYNNYGIDEVV